MRGLVASVTSCIGGKDERFAVNVKPMEQERYFVYKSMSEFEALWSRLEVIAAEVRQKQKEYEAAMLSATTITPITPVKDVGLLAKWLASFVDHYSFRTIIQDLRAQGQETISPLNVVLHSLLRRVSALYVENTILRCGCCNVGRQLAFLMRNFLEFTEQDQRKMIESPRLRKRQLSEMRPEDADPRKRTMPMFPMRCDGPRSPKSRKLSAAASDDFMIPTIHKIELNMPIVAAVPARRRVFAEVDFSV